MRRKDVVRASGAEAQGALARGAEALGAKSLGALAVGAAATGAVAIGAVAVGSLVVRRARVRRLLIDELEVRRLRVRELIVEDERDAPHPFSYLEEHDYVNLTTFRKSGEAVPTPVWFAPHDGRLYVTTEPDSGKMKRIRNDPRVVLQPCNAWGRPRGESVEAVGRPLDEEEAPERATRAFHEKYRFWLALFHLSGRRQVGELTLEIQPAGPGEGDA